MQDSSADHEDPRPHQDELTSYPDAIPQAPANQSAAVPPSPSGVGGPTPYPPPVVPPSSGAPYPPPPNAASAPSPNPAAHQPYPHATGHPGGPYPQAGPGAGPAIYPSAVPGGQSPYPRATPFPTAAPVGAGPKVVPQNVQIAFYVMLAGAVVTLLSAAYLLTTIDRIRSDALDASGGVFRGDDLDVVVYAGLAGGILVSLVTAGLWVWMAFACRAGKNWARITGTVFFGLNVLSSAVSVISVFATGSRTDLQSMAFTVVTVIIGLAAVILLWNPRSAAFFAPAPPPGYQPYPPTGPW